MKINLIASVLIIIAIILGVCIAQEGCRQNAMINEYEYLLADAWTAQQDRESKLADCKDQLGVFYHDEDKK